MTNKFENVVEVLLGRRRHDNVIPRRGGDIPQQRYWVFHLGVTKKDAVAQTCSVKKVFLEISQKS